MTAYERINPYPKPPIEEALLQFVLHEPAPWNITTPGLIYDAIKADYPAEPVSQEALSATFQTDESTGLGANFALNRGDMRVIYRSTDATKLAIAHPQHFTIGSNRPYDGWPSLRARMLDAWGKLGDVLRHPIIESVSLRYINRITVPNLHLNTDDYFTIPVRTVDEGSWSYGSFVYRVESARDHVTRARTTFATIDSPSPDENHFLLDLEFLHLQPTADVNEALLAADELKNLENAEFELSITDTTRELFK